MMDSNKNQDQAKKAKQKMLDAIQSGDAKMEPKWHFVLETILLITGGVLALLLVLYLASFVVFVLHQTGLWYAPTFGVAGWFSFFRSLPWILIILLIIFMVILGVLVKRYSFVYERPAMYLFIGIVAFVALGGFLIAATPFHRTLFDAARNGNLPVLGGFYRGFGMQHFGDIHRGSITGTTTNGFVIRDDGGQTSTVLYGHFPFSIGNDIVIFGERTPSGTINASGIQQVSQ
jgi:hypothetical protein